LAGGLVMLPAIDTPRAIRMLTEDENEQLGLSSDDVFKVGFANLRKHLKPLMSVANVARARQMGQLSGDPYQSSRLALLRVLVAPGQGAGRQADHRCPRYRHGPLYRRRRPNRDRSPAFAG